MPERLKRVLDVLTSRVFVRTAFLLFFVWICVRLTLFVRWAKGDGAYVPRPEAVAGLLPVGHFTSFFAWLRGGGWDALLPAGLVIILAALAVSLLLKRGFCGWICPLGSVWELAALLGRKLLGGRNLRVPRWLDILGRGVRYAITGMMLLALASVPLAAAVEFRTYRYMWVADIKILDALVSPVFIILAALAFVLSMLFGAVWCRYLCPVGGLYSIFGMASPCTVVRDDEVCISCSRCTRVCHAFVDVEHAKATVRAAECDGCMDCVRVCPAPGALQAKALGLVRIPPQVWPLLVVGLWLGIYAVAKVSGHWDTTIPVSAFRQVIQSGLLEQRTPGGL